MAMYTHIRIAHANKISVSHMSNKVLCFVLHQPSKQFILHLVHHLSNNGPLRWSCWSHHHLLALLLWSHHHLLALLELELLERVAGASAGAVQRIHEYSGSSGAVVESMHESSGQSRLRPHCPGIQVIITNGFMDITRFSYLHITFLAVLDTWMRPNRR